MPAEDLLARWREDAERNLRDGTAAGQASHRQARRCLALIEALEWLCPGVQMLGERNERLETTITEALDRMASSNRAESLDRLERAEAVLAEADRDL